jgi:hypothetical protein
MSGSGSLIIITGMNGDGEGVTRDESPKRKE